jgi:polysaccharide biosynthesis/export protein
MRSNKFRLLALLMVAALGVPAGAYVPQDKDKKTRPRTVGQQPQQSAPTNDKIKERLEPDDTSAPPRADVPVDTLANRQESMNDDAAQLVPYYNNYLASYRLGPEDIISVSVFGLERYSRAGITVPPDGVVTLPLIPEGVFVVGKTTKQVADEITKKLDEYVIEPKVYVSLEKALSATFSVLGDVAQPGVRAMSRRLSVAEAIAVAGGVLSTGDKSKVYVARRGADGIWQPVRINLAAIERGRAPDNYYLNPGDQVLVPGNRFKSVQKIMQSVLPVLPFFRIFTPGL